MDSRQPQAFSPGRIEFIEQFAALSGQLYLSQLASTRGLVGTIQIASRIASLRDVETGAHLQRMAKYSHVIARGLQARGHRIDDEFVEYVHLFAPLHDIGKVGIPDRILLKPGRLDAEEMALMRTHVEIGLRMVESMSRDLGIAGGLPRDIMCNIVGAHHERCDGSGYPAGLRGDAIPLEGGIVAVADVFDALSSARPYKPAWPFEECLTHLRHEADEGRLDRDCVEVLCAEADAVRLIQRQFADD